MTIRLYNDLRTARTFIDLVKGGGGEYPVSIPADVLRARGAFPFLRNEQTKHGLRPTWTTPNPLRPLLIPGHTGKCWSC